MDSLLKRTKGFSLIELLVVIAVLVIIMGTAALTMGTSMRDSRTKKAAFDFKAMLTDATKEAMANYKPVVVRKDTSFSNGIRLMMFMDRNEDMVFNGNDRMLAYFVVTGNKVDPGRPPEYSGDYYFTPDVLIKSSTQSGGTSVDLSNLYGSDFNSVPVLDDNSIIVVRPEGVYVVRVGGSVSPVGGVVLFRNIQDIDEATEERQYFVFVTKTFTRVLKMEDDGTGNFVIRELQ